MTPKQQRFVEEYLIDLNATQAAIRAGYSVKTAGQIGEENLKKPEIAEAVAERIEKRSEQTGIDAAWVLQKAVELHKQAMAAGAFAPAKGALELVGKHVDVQAFREQIDHRVAMTGDQARAQIKAFLAKNVVVDSDGVPTLRLKHFGTPPQAVPDNGGRLQ